MSETDLWIWGSYGKRMVFCGNGQQKEKAGLDRARREVGTRRGEVSRLWHGEVLILDSLMGESAVMASLEAQLCGSRKGREGRKGGRGAGLGFSRAGRS
jgi:hypothetical protein